MFIVDHFGLLWRNPQLGVISFKSGHHQKGVSRDRILRMNFRTILREATRPEHDRLDGMFTALDIAAHAGFARFVSVHLACFTAMSERAPTGGHAHGLLCEMTQRLGLDNALLSGAEAGDGIALPACIDPRAIDYLVAGSRLGSKVLFKRWAGSSDPVVQRAHHYFSLDSDPSFWRATCDALAAIDPAGPEAKRIVADTKALFGLFSSVYAQSVEREVVGV